jgi:hypothetical protein
MSDFTLLDFYAGLILAGECANPDIYRDRRASKVPPERIHQIMCEAALQLAQVMLDTKARMLQSGELHE